MTSRYDAIIVGAGPAGSWAAYRLARGGARVALIDGSHPREKPCGGGVTGRVLQVVRPALVHATHATLATDALFDAVPIAHAIFAHGARQADVTLDATAAEPPLSVASRQACDGALLAAACRAGADMIPARVTAVHRATRGWTASTRDGAIAGDWLVGADGANSLVRRSVLQPFRRADLSIATGFYARDLTSSDVVISFEDSPAGYLWSFPRADHLAIGVCAQADESSSASLLQRAAQWIAQHAARAGSLERYSWPIPSLSAAALDRECAGGDGWMLAGDAAGLVDPITREGIYFAVRSADLAADALLGGSQAARVYVDELRRLIYPELRRATRLKERFYRPHFMSLLVSSLARSGQIRAIMADLVSGQQAYCGLRRRLLSTLELGLMFELFGF